MAFLSRKFLEQRAEELHQELKFARGKETQITRTCPEGQVQSLELEARLRVLEEDKRTLSNEVDQTPGSSPCLTKGPGQEAGGLVLAAPLPALPPEAAASTSPSSSLG